MRKPRKMATAGKRIVRQMSRDSHTLTEFIHSYFNYCFGLVNSTQTQFIRLYIININYQIFEFYIPEFFF